MPFLKDFSITSFTSLIVTLVALLNNIIITRQIGTEGRGIYSVISNIILLLGLLFGEGLRRSNTILVGKNSSNLNKLINDTLLFSILLSVIFILIYFSKSLWNQFIPNLTNEYIILTLIISVLSIIWIAYQAIFLGLQKILKFNIIQLTSVVSFFVFTAIGIYLFDFNLMSIIIGLAVSSLLTSLLCIILFIKNYNYKFHLKINFLNKNFFLISQKSTISAIEIFLLYKGDIFIINFFLGAVQTGLYSIAALFSEFIQRFTNVLGVLLVSKTVNDKTGVIFNNTAKVVRVAFAINLMIIIILFFVGRYLIVLFFGNGFQFSFHILLFLMPGLLFFGPGSLLYSFFIGRGYPKEVIIINASCSLLNIILNAILIPKFGVIIAASISSITYFIWTISLIFLFNISTKIPIKDVILIKKEDISYLYLALKKVL